MASNNPRSSESSPFVPLFHPCAFTFEGMAGSVDSGGFVRLGNAGFHLENAKPALRAAITEARKFDQVACRCGWYGRRSEVVMSLPIEDRPSVATCPACGHDLEPRP